MPEKTVTSVTELDKGIWKKFHTVLWKETTWAAEKSSLSEKGAQKLICFESHGIQMENMEQKLWIFRTSHGLILL